MTTKNTTVIREMEFEDLHPVFNLGEKLFTVSKWPILYRTWDEYEVMERFMGDSEYCLVVEKDNQLEGFIIGTVIKKRKSPWIYGYIVWLGVTPESQNGGIGKKLMNSLIRRFKNDGVHIVMADTAKKNKKAINFFRKQGFLREEPHLYLYRNLKNTTRKK